MKRPLFTVKVVVEKDDDQFHAYCPALPGVHAGGDSKKEAVENAITAAQAYIRSLIDDGRPIPVGVAAPLKHPTCRVGARTLRHRSVEERTGTFQVAGP